MESAAYQVTADGEVIYSGTAFRRPGAAELSVRLNDVCADFLSNPLPSLKSGSGTETQAAPELVRTFGVQILLGGTVSEVAEVKFSADWSYDPDWPLTGLANDSIVPLLDRRQRLVLTSYAANTYLVRIEAVEGPNPSLRVGEGMTTAYNVTVNLSNARSVTCGSLTWQVADTCCRYALYYLNAHGGWDSLLVRGASSVSDSMERSTAWRDYDNSDPRNRGRVNWRNSVTRMWTLHTGWLTDAQAAKMHHLLESTDVYLLDLETQELRAVVLTDTDAPVKTFKGEGRRLVDYALNAQCAQDIERR